MNEQNARTAVLAAINTVAPEVDTDSLGTESRLRQDLELDSLDFLEVLERIAQSTGVITVEEDYPTLTTVQSLIDHVVARA